VFSRYPKSPSSLGGPVRIVCSLLRTPQAVENRTKKSF